MKKYFERGNGLDGVVFGESDVHKVPKLDIVGGPHGLTISAIIIDEFADYERFDAAMKAMFREATKRTVEVTPPGGWPS